MGKRMGLAASAEYCRRFGLAFRAGVDIVSLCRSEAKHGREIQRLIMARVADGVASGSPLAESMVAADPKFFPTLMVSMVRLGEQTGRLERTMLQLADHYQHRLQVRRMFFSAIAWPMIQLFAAIMILGLLIWIIGLLPSAPGREPFDPLGFGLRGSKGVAIYFFYVSVIAGWLALLFYAGKNNWFNLHALVPLTFMIPKVGPALQTITLARFTWTLSMSLDAGLDPFRAIALSMDSTGSEHYRSETKTAENAIRKGDSLTGALASTQVFPSDFLNAMEVAELSGTTSESLGHLAEDYDTKAKMAIRTLAGIASGVIWLCVVVALVFIILKMAMQVFGVYSDAMSM
ncbi:type II secretion system F family protein [Planctomycetaceae bacterium SH139]